MTDALNKQLDGAGLKHAFELVKGVTGELEAPYTEVEWVESNGQQYVYLDWKPPIATWGFEADFIIRNAFTTNSNGWNSGTNAANGGLLFGTINSSGYNDVEVGAYSTSGIFRVGGSTNYNVGWRTDKSRQTLKLHGTTVTKPDGTTMTVTRASEASGKPYSNMTVFAYHVGNRKSGVGGVSWSSTSRIYSLKFFDGNTLKVDLVGAIRKKDGATGLYDKVANHFYPALGMTYGNAVGYLGEPMSIADRLQTDEPFLVADNTVATRMWHVDAPTISKLEDGQTIVVTPRYNITNSYQTTELADWDDTDNNAYVYIKLKLKDGTTTDWVPCWYAHTTRLTSHYQVMPTRVTYRENCIVNASTTGANPIARGWFCDPNYDSNTFQNTVGYQCLKTGAIGIWATSLFMEDGNGTYQNICTASDGTLTASNRTTATTKKANPNGFRVGSTVSYTNTTYAANTHISGNNVVYTNATLIDSRYSLNTTLTANSLTPQAPVYLVGEIGSDGLYYLDTVWWTQTPTTQGKVYVLVGGCYDSTTSNCRINLFEHNPWYVYDGTRLVELDHKRIQDLQSSVSAISGAYVSGVKGNAETNYRTGQVNITPANVGAVAKAGDTMTGMLTVPMVKTGRTVQSVARYIYSATAKETVIWTGIKYVSSTHMPVVKLNGYAYGAGKTTELRIALYIYQNEFYSSRTVTNLGVWNPNVYLFTYTKNGVEYVAIGLEGTIYYNMFSVDVQDEMGGFNNIDVDGWTINGYADTGHIPAVGTNHCVSVNYGIDILNPPKVNSHTVDSDVPANAVFTDTTYSAGTGLSKSGTTFNHSNSVTAGTAGTSSATSGTNTLAVPYVTYDAQGHVTASGTHTHTIGNASTSAYGVTKLSSATDSTSEALAATPKAVSDALASAKNDADESYTPQSVLPADNGHVKTKFRITKVDNAGSATWYYPLVQLPSDNASNYASAIISGRIGGWVSDNMSQFTALVWNRNSTGIALLDIAGSATAMSSIWGLCDIVVYTDADATTDTVYLKCSSYFTFDIDVELFQSTASFKWTGEYQTTTPSGTLGAQASTSTRRVEIINGKLMVGGVDMSVVSNLSGTLGIAHGGTGKTSGVDAANYFLNELSTGSSDPQDNDYYISQYVGGGTTTTTYHRRPVSKLWNYIKSKISSWMKNNTSKGALGWSSSTNDTMPITSNTLAYWDGSFRASDHASNLDYCSKGAFGTAAVASLSDSTTSSSSTAAASSKAVKTVQDNLDALKVGGRNLLLDTAREHGSSDVLSNLISYYLSEEGLKLGANDRVTVSFDVKSTTATWMDCYWRSAVGGSGTGYAQDTDFYPSFQITAANTWYHFEATGVAGPDVASAAVLAFRRNTSEHGGSATNTLTLRNVMLEKATKASSWTLAPEDVHVFSNVKVGSTTVAADTTTDTLELVAGSNVTLTPDATNDKITIAATDTTYSAGTGISLSGTTFSNSGVTGVKGDAESSYRTGQVNITAANVGAVALSGNETVAGNKTFTGNSTAYNLKVGQHVQTDTTVRDQGIEVLDVRNAPVYVNSLSQKANFFFKNTGVPKAGWWSILHVKGWTGAYSAWELAGPANGSDERKTPLYVRTGDASNNWSSWRALAEKSMIDEVYSRGEQLIVNGNGFMGDNTNFSSWTFDGSVANNSKGSFTRTPAYAAIDVDDLIPVDPSKSYAIEFDVKCGTDASLPVGAKMYAFLNYYDVDGLLVSYYHGIYHRANTTTTLAQDLNDGDTVVHFTDLTNWWIGTTADHQRSFIFWDYTNSFGYTYPPNTYSRHEAHAVYASNDSVNKTNNTITLSSAWNGGTVPAGTKVSQNASGGNYDYVWNHTTQSTFPTEWKHVKSIRHPENMWKGVATVKVGFLWNYGYTTSAKQQQIWVTNLSMRAIDAECESLGFGKLINYGSDLNSIVEVGEYHIDTNANVASITNKPSGLTNAFTLIVSYPLSYRNTTYIAQELTEFQYGRKWRRLSLNSGASWGAWVNGDGLGAAAYADTVPIANGGTGKTTAAEAWTALGGGAIGKKASLAASDIPAHAASATTYGAGSSSNYGHVKLSDSTSSDSDTTSGTAATPKAVKAAYNLANTANGTANSALSAAQGGIVFDTTYSIASNGTVTFTAHVYSCGSEVTSSYADADFSWYYRLGTGTSTVDLGTGKTKAIQLTTLGYGGSVGCTFTDNN